MGECSVCYQEIPGDRLLCPACEDDLRAERDEADEAERMFRERQQRAAAVE
jgi:hypothetical protein